MDSIATILGAGWQPVLIGGAGIVAGLASAAAVVMRRRLQRLERSVAALTDALERTRASVQQQQGIQRNLAAGLKRSSERIGQVELRAASRPYEQAIQMATQGGSEDGLMRYFGLTDGEAALVRLLHGDSRRSPPPDRPT